MKKLNIIMNKTTLKCFLPDLLILVVAIISVILYDVIPQPQSWYLFFIISYLLIILSLYVKLYTWRNLKISIKSYIFFMLNTVQFMLYLWSFYLLFFVIQSPIHLKDLSVYSQYRYLLMSIIVISISLFFFIYLLSPSSSAKLGIQDFMSKITYPYLKEEVRLILYTWNDALFSSLCSKLIDKLYQSKVFLFSYIISHFIIFYMPRVVVLFLFTSFVWFDGDLRLVICKTPFLFLSWLLSFFDYYFQIFFKSHCNYISSILSAKQVNLVPSSFGTIFTSLDNITFTLTPNGLDQGYITENMPILINEWHIAAYLSVYFEKYNQFLVNFNRFLFFIQVVNGFNLTYYFFFKPYFQTKYLMFSALFKRASFQGGSTRYYATEASRVLTKTGKQYLSGNHPSLIDRAEQNPDNRPQNYIPALSQQVKNNAANELVSPPG
jgi:hypothetical protein